MASTYEPIATVTLSSAAATIDFTSIPGTYTDLRLILTQTTTAAGRTAYITYNSDGNANYSYQAFGSNGTANGGWRNTSAYYMTIDDFANDGTSTTIPNLSVVDIFGYASSNTYKTALANSSAMHSTIGQVFRFVGCYRSNTAITSIQIILGSSTFSAGSSATLYGILKA